MKLFNKIKTDALMIYIRTTLEELIKRIERNEYNLNLYTQEFNNEILKNMYILLNNLKKTIFNSEELEYKVAIRKLKNTKNEWFSYENALFFYFNIIVNKMILNIKNGNTWIPDQIIFSLLSEWIIENEKPIPSYLFLKDFDYTKLLSYYEITRNNTSNDSLKRNISIMFNVSSSVIQKLKASKYKINNTRKSKSRKRKGR